VIDVDGHIEVGGNVTLKILLMMAFLIILT
jgi:hypothetical protein